MRFFYEGFKATGKKPGMLIYLLFVLFIIGAAIFWRFVPLANQLDVTTIMEWTRNINTFPLLVLFFLGAYFLAGLTMFPISILNTVLALMLGPWKGFALAYFCNVISAICCYLLVRSLGRRPLHAISGKKMQHISSKLGERGILSMLAMRNSPMAFGMINMTAALTHIKFTDYLIGSLAGMLPGTLAVCLLAGEIKNLVTESSITSGLIIAVVLLALFLIYKKLLNKKINQ